MCCVSFQQETGSLETGLTSCGSSQYGGRKIDVFSPHLKDQISLMIAITNFSCAIRLGSVAEGREVVKQFLLLSGNHAFF